jgi:hypothetical protein
LATVTVTSQFTDLEAAIAAGSGLVAAHYTPQSWGVYTAALAVAEGLLANPAASQAQVNAAVVALDAARTGLVVDKSILQAVVDKAAAITAEDTTAEAFAAVQAALDAARAILASSTATPQQVAQAAAAVLDAVNEAIRAANADVSAVRDMAEGVLAAVEAQGLVEADYTPQSWQALAAARAHLAGLLASGSATSADLNAAIQAVTSALAGLIPAGDGGPSPSPTVSSPSPSPSKPSPSTPGGSSPTPGGPSSPPGGGVTPPPNTGPGPNTGLTGGVVKVAVGQKVLTLVKGQKAKLVAAGYTGAGAKVKAAYKSSKAKVAKITKTGVVKAKKVGKATVTITAGAKKTIVKVRVVPKARSLVAKKVKAKGIVKTLKAGQVVYLVGKVTPAKATKAVVKFTSSNKTVATLTKTGRLVAKGAGKTVITLKAGKAKKKYTLTITP